MTYLLDANVFIQAKNLHYGLDFCPAFWDWLVTQNDVGKVYSIEQVGEAGDDELVDWAKARGAGFFLPADKKLVAELPKVSAWATSQKYEPAAISTFLQVADYYLVAHALAHKHVVVTHEVASGSTKKIKIPNACIGLGIKFMTPYAMLRHERARFVLKKDEST